jgi:hypothetical protein
MPGAFANETELPALRLDVASSALAIRRNPSFAVESNELLLQTAFVHRTEEATPFLKACHRERIWDKTVRSAVAGAPERRHRIDRTTP